MKALLLLAFAGIPLTAATADRTYTGEYSREKIAPIYEWVCDYMASEYDEFECPPQPVVATAETKPGNWGYYYRGSQIVWASDRLTLQPLSVFGEAIIAHEMVHYMLSEIDALQTDKDACRNENLAWIAYNQYVLSYGFEHLLNDEWWIWYPRCDSGEGDTSRSVLELIGVVPLPLPLVPDEVPVPVE
jgi:hypothetical protein